MHQGWIKFWRKAWDNPWMKRPAYLSVFLWLLSNAAYKKRGCYAIFNGTRIPLQPGQLTTGAYQIAEGTGVKRGTVERILKTLQVEEQIDIQTTSRCSLITIKNWQFYQREEGASEEQVGNFVGTVQDFMRTNKEG